MRHSFGWRCVMFDISSEGSTVFLVLPLPLSLSVKFPRCDISLFLRYIHHFLSVVASLAFFHTLCLCTIAWALSLRWLCRKTRCVPIYLTFALSFHFPTFTPASSHCIPHPPFLILLFSPHLLAQSSPSPFSLHSRSSCALILCNYGCNIWGEHLFLQENVAGMKLTIIVITD